MEDRRPERDQQTGADRDGPGGVVIPFRPRRELGPAGPARGPVIGPRNRIPAKQRIGEAGAFGLVFGLVAFLLDRPAAAVPFFLLGLLIAGSLWFSIAPRRGAIDNGTIIVTALVAALAGWLAYTAINALVAGGGFLAIFSAFVGGLSYAFVVAWPAGILGGFMAKRLSQSWRPPGRS